MGIGAEQEIVEEASFGSGTRPFLEPLPQAASPIILPLTSRHMRLYSACADVIAHFSQVQSFASFVLHSVVNSHHYCVQPYTSPLT